MPFEIFSEDGLTILDWTFCCKSIYLYRCTSDYELSEDGNLNLIYIKDASRKPLNELEYKDIKGHALILKYDNILNLNLVFIQTEQQSNGDIALRMVG
ncbi:hypothetical protein ACIEHO_07560 [Jejuia sp. DST062]